MTVGYATTPPCEEERENLLQIWGCTLYGDDAQNDNGTPAQPQPCYAGSRNGGGSVRTTVGVKLP